MARRRVYRHHIRCPDLGSNRMRLDRFPMADKLAAVATAAPVVYPAGPSVGRGRR